MQIIHKRQMRFYEIRVILCSHHNMNKNIQLKNKLMALLLSIRDPEILIPVSMIISMFLLRKEKKYFIVMQSIYNNDNYVINFWL